MVVLCFVFILLFQEKVLHNVMSIFTFMGASAVRQDDSYSFEVISKTLDTVIPALIQVCEGLDNLLSGFCNQGLVVLTIDCVWLAQGLGCSCFR